LKIIIDGIAYGGYGVGRIDGKAIFVDYAIPGDELEIEIYNDKNKYSFAKIQKIISPSIKRVESPCVNFGICGGCSYLNLNYDDEIDFKVSILKDQLKKIASIDPEINVITDQRYYYRSHSNVKCNGVECGFYERNSNNIKTFPEAGCLLVSKKINDSIKLLNNKTPHGDLKIAENKDEFVFFSNEIIDEKVGVFNYRRNINGFFQSNIYLREKMLNLVLKYSELNTGDEFVDICAGCGFFSIPLSKKASYGSGYDIDKVSINFAKKNALLNNCTNLRFYLLSEAEINPAKINPKTVIVDPPRSGISKRGRRTINAINPEIIVYVSCNPSTFSRDIVDFMKNGYILEELTLIDMFPCTHHIEVISKFLRKS